MQRVYSYGGIDYIILDFKAVICLDSVRESQLPRSRIVVLDQFIIGLNKCLHYLE